MRDVFGVHVVCGGCYVACCARRSTGGGQLTGVAVGVGLGVVLMRVRLKHD